MKEKKFNIPAILVGAAGVVLAFFLLGAEAVIAGVIGLVLALSKRETHLTRLPVVLSVLAIVAGLAWIVWLIYQGVTGISATDYWFYVLLFGEPR